MWRRKKKGVTSMKIERISDSQIRCTLSDVDLSERNLNLSELAYGSEKARRLFREMVQKASVEVGFEAEDLPLMVEAIPLSNQSVMLVITKVDDPEEMDTRFSRFAPAPEGDLNAFDPAAAAPVLEGAEQPFTPLHDEKIPPKAEEPRMRVFLFQSLDKVIEAAKALNGMKCGGKLYKHPQSGSYYLVLTEKDVDPAVFAPLCNKLTEYGTRVRQNYSSDSYFSEHYEVILKKDALSSLAKI